MDPREPRIGLVSGVPDPGEYADIESAWRSLTGGDAILLGSLRETGSEMPGNMVALVSRPGAETPDAVGDFVSRGGVCLCPAATITEVVSGNPAASGRLFVWNPVLYRVELLETARVVLTGGIGETVAADIRHAFPFERDLPFHIEFVLRLFTGFTKCSWEQRRTVLGEPGGWDVLAWGGGTAARCRLELSGTGEWTGLVSGREGSIRYSLPGDRSCPGTVELVTRNAPPHALPIPEGTGEYYCIKDCLDSIASEGRASVVSPDDARRWTERREALGFGPLDGMPTGS